MKEQKQDLLDNETEITRENVQRIGEVLALIVIRYVSSHGNHNLYSEEIRKSDGYDLNNYLR